MKVFAARLAVTLSLMAVYQTSPLGTGYPMSGPVHILAFIVIFFIADRLINKHLE